MQVRYGLFLALPCVLGTASAVEIGAQARLNQSMAATGQVQVGTDTQRQQRFVQAGKTRCRRDAAADSPIAMRLSRGSAVWVLEERDGWARIETNGDI